MTRADFELDEEFRTLLPPLAADELSNLTELMQEHGCMSPLVVWEDDNGKRILIDGYHRLEICRALKIGYTTTTLSFASRSRAMIWVFRNQSSRRNMTSTQVAARRGSCILSRTEGETVAAVAESLGISKRQAIEDSKFAAAVEQLEPEVQTAVLTAGKHEAARVRKAGRDLPAKDRAAAIKSVVTGEPLPINDSPSAPGVERMQLENKEIEKWCRAAKALKEQLPNISHWDDGREAVFDDRLDVLIGTVRACKGRSLCVHCAGDGNHKGKFCEVCRGSGFLCTT